MSENRSLLTDDPFSFATGQVTVGREPILRGYWLAQLLFYYTYLMAGDFGIIVLRVLIFMTIFLMIFMIGRKVKADISVLLFVLILTGFISAHFTGERPQLFSFFIAPIVFYLLNVLKSRSPESGITAADYIALPLVMIIWANLHGGFILGSVLIFLFGISEAIRKIYRKSMNYFYLRIYMIIMIAVLCSFINPNTYRLYVELMFLQGGILQQRTSEYMSPMALFAIGQFLVPYWIYLVLFLTALWINIRIADKTDIVVFIFLAVISFFAFRYIPFFVFITAPYLAAYISRMIEEKFALRKLFLIFTIALVIFTVFYSLMTFDRSFGASVKSPLKSNRFPENAAFFMLVNHPSGNMFNHLTWGGYFIWKLYPQYKVFIDGRTLNLKVLSDYTYVLWDQKRWETLLDSYGIDIIIIPSLNPFNGELYGLTGFLYEDQEWQLVYADDTALIFLRGAANKKLIDRFTISKKEIYKHIIRQADFLIRSGLNNYHVWNAMYKGYSEIGMHDYADKAGKIAESLR